MSAIARLSRVGILNSWLLVWGFWVPCGFVNRVRTDNGRPSTIRHFRSRPAAIRWARRKGFTVTE